MCEDLRLFTTQTRGIQTFSFLFHENNTPPPPPPPSPCACYTTTTGIRSHKSITFGKNAYMLVTHSFSTRAAGLLLGAVRRPSQGFASVCFLLLLLFVFSVLQISCAVTKPKLGLSLGTKVKICCITVSHWRSSEVG